MVETIQQIQKTQTQIEGPSTAMEGWNITWLGMPNTTPMEAQKSQEVMKSHEHLITVKEIFLDIGKQMLKTSCTLKQLFKFKRYLWQKLKPEKTQILSKATTNKQVNSSIPKVGTTIVAIDNHMVIQVQIGKNTIEDVLLDGGFGVNIITLQLRLRLGLPKPKLAPYHLRMVNQTTTKPMGLIKDLKIYVHGIP